MVCLDSSLVLAALKRIDNLLALDLILLIFPKAQLPLHNPYNLRDFFNISIPRIV